MTSYKPACASSTLLLFLKITTTIMIQYVAVDKSAQPKSKKGIEIKMLNFHIKIGNQEYLHSIFNCLAYFI